MSASDQADEGGKPINRVPVESVVKEAVVTYEMESLDRTGALSAANAVTSHVRSLLSTPEHLYPAGVVHLINSDHVANLIGQQLPADTAWRSLSEWPGLPDSLMPVVADLKLRDLFCRRLCELAETRRTKVEVFAVLREEALRHLSEFHPPTGE